MAREGFGLVAVRMDRFARAMGDDVLQAVTEVAAFTVKDSAIKLSVRTVGGDRRMSRFGKGRSRGRPRGGVGYDYIGHGVAVVKYRPAGWWALLETGARPHDIGVRKGRKPPPRLAIDGKVRTGPVHHPGTRPKAIISRATADAEPRVTARVEEALHDELVKLLEG